MAEGINFLFLQPSVPNKLDRSQRAEINAHVARNSHHVRRTRRVATKQRADPDPYAISQFCQCKNSSETNQLTQRYFCGLTSCNSRHTSQFLLPIAVGHGNSDPFNAQCIPLDSQANLYLNFGHQALENTILNTGYRGWCMPRGWTPSQTTTIVELNLDGQQIVKRVAPDYLMTEWSKTHAYSILAYYATALATVTRAQKHVRDALRYTTKCMASLRGLISSSQCDASVDIELLIYRLLRAEIVSRNFTGASTHTNLLGRLFQARKMEGKLDPGVLALALFQDNTLSLTLWREPTFDSAWLYKVYAGDWVKAGLYLPRVLTITAESYSTYNGDDYISELLHATKLLFTQNVRMQHTGRTACANDWYWFLSYGEYLHTCLFNFCIKQDLTTATNLDNSTSGMNRSLALGALLALRYRKNELKVNGIALYSASTNILEKLATCTTQFESHVSYGEAYQYADALLWVSFVAALVENNFSAPKAAKKDRKYEHTWLNRLTQSITSRKITSFQELQDVLVQFPYTPEELPLPVDDWLDNAFDTSKEPEILCLRSA